MKLASDSFQNGDAMPARHGHGEGGNRHPQLRWTEVPAGVSSLALLCMDADATSGEDLFHWSLVDIPPTPGTLCAIAEAALPPLPLVTVARVPLRQGLNSFDAYGYYGPALSPHARHHFIFRLYALDVARLTLPERFSGADLLDAMYGHIVDEAQLIGIFQRT